MTHRPQWLSEGVEVLLSALEQSAHEEVDFDVVVVGSGYGGAVAAARLARARANGKRLRVCVLERGQEYLPGTFPRGISRLPGSVRFNRYDDPDTKGRADGLFDFRLGADMSVLVGSGLGGTSLINASVAERAHDDVFEDPAWPAELRRDRKRLDDCYGRAECMLGVVDARVKDILKYRELGAFATAIGEKVRPARLAITYDGTRPNRQGVKQDPCDNVGNCVIGCNRGAKNTLDMNYLPEARRFGAKLYTNATVSHVEKVETVHAGKTEVSWRVCFDQTSARHPPLGQAAGAPLRPVRARHVVLAAGTLGSTEILMRSRARGLRVSAQLGKRFSGNGDMISVLYDQHDRVYAAPAERTNTVGPTITGVVEKGRARADRVVIEELGIPVSLRRVFEEIVTTGALPVKLAKSDRSRHQSEGNDPAAVNPAAIDRSQIFAAMGDDGARGRLEMVEGWETAGADGAIRVDWKDAGAEPIYLRQDALLIQSEKLGGTYLRSPLWKPLPESLAGMLSGKNPEGKLLSVHPLGGCPMGDDAKSGVVDDMGRVYDPAKPENLTHTHPGLLVLDGAIVPTAIGVNPLLTITALAERAIERYIETCGWSIDFKDPFDCALPSRPKAPDQRGEAVGKPSPVNTAVRFAEKMQGPLTLVPGSSNKFTAELEVEFDPITDIPGFLRQGPHELQLRNATLKLDGGKPAPVSGSVFWMERGRSGWLCRVARAIWAWIRTRALADFFQRKREAGLLAALKPFFTKSGSFFALASNVGEVRYLRYEMTLKDRLMQGATEILPAGSTMHGLKTLRYVKDGNPWRQLSELEVTVAHPGGQRRAVGTLTIDPLHLLHRFAAQLQIIGQRDLPSAMMDIASIGLFLARIVLKVHFWSFRLPEYEKPDPERECRRMPGVLDGLNMERHRVTVPGANPTKAGSLDLPLTRYRKQSTGDRPPVLLIHGFGSGGIQFAHPDLKRNLVRHLADQGFDVWVAELRTSIAVPSSFNQWTLDEVATEDIPAIVEYVLRALKTTNWKELDVAAHCIGSAMFCTAVLDGRLARKVRSAVLLQVGPLITLSEANTFRAHVAAALRRYMLADFMYSSVDSSADWQEALLDRLLSTYPYPASERPWHSLWPPCRPHTHIANCNRSAGVFGRLFQHRNVDETALDALGDMLGHVNLRTFEQTMQYAFLGRLTDYDACNRYVTDRNVAAHFNFPVLFVHGAKNDVFDPETSKRSLKLLNDVFGVDPRFRDIRMLRRYGHLDPLIGATAETDVYRHISAFLQAAAGLPRSTPLARYVRFPLRPIIGPLLGWTRRQKDRNGIERWTARIWCRTDDEYSNAHFIVAVVLDARGVPVPGYTFRGALRNWSGAGSAKVLDLLAVVDVELPDIPGDVEIVIVGAHASVERKADVEGASLAAETAVQAVRLSEDAAAEAKTQFAAELPAPDTLPDRYGQEVIKVRATWSAQAEAGRRARRVCDSGYDARPDSVLLRGTLLERLDPGRTELDFALGSCRYSATLIDRERADASFGRLRDLVERKEPVAPAPSLLLLAGDQIYADATAGLFDAKNRRARFYDAYREVWTAPNAREVLRQLPTYMMLDDHEVGDDWHPEDPADPEERKMRESGLVAFEEYQIAHSPQSPDLLGVIRPPRPYHYSFAAGGFPFFVCDTRTDRTGRAQIMQGTQFGALKDWLQNQESTNDSRPKFVLSPSIVVPFLEATRGNAAYAARSDGWDGFPDSLRELFRFIAGASIRNVVFLCGDPHISMSSEITIARTGQPDLAALCIVASPLYAPYPFANAQAHEFVADTTGQALGLGGGAHMHYVRKASVAGDSFTLVSVKPDAGGWSVCASVYPGEGAPVVTCFKLP